MILFEVNPPPPASSKGDGKGWGWATLRFLGIHLANLYFLVFPMKDPNVELLITRKVDPSGHGFTYSNPNQEDPVSGRGRATRLKQATAPWPGPQVLLKDVYRFPP